MMRVIYLILIISTVMQCSHKEQLRVFVWANIIPQKVYQKFEKETGIHVIEDVISSNEELYTKIKTGASQYDIINPSLDYASIMIREDMVIPIDKSLVPNIKNIDPQIMKQIRTIDPNNSYIIPFVFGPTIIAYDTRVIDEEVTGFDIFFNSKYKGRMTLLNDMREVMGSALTYLGYTIEETSPSALKEVYSLLSKWKKNILRFDSDSFHIAYANGEVDLVHAYADTLIPSLSKEKLAHTRFVVPEKGAMMWLDSFLVLKTAKNQNGAMQFINFIHRPEIYAIVLKHIKALSLNVPAQELVESIPIVQIENIQNATMITEIPDNTLVLQSQLWEELQVH